MAGRKQTRYRKIEVSFLSRELGEVESLLHLCRLIGKIESLPKSMSTLSDSTIYYLILKLKPGINREKATNVLLDTWPVQSIRPVR